MGSYGVPMRDASLSATFSCLFLHQTETSMVTEVRMLNVCPQRSQDRKPKKMAIVLDTDTNTITVYTTLDGEPTERTMFVSVNEVAPVNRGFNDQAFMCLAAGSAAKTAYLAGLTPPQVSKTYNFFLPMAEGEEDWGKFLWVEGYAYHDEEAIGISKCLFLKKMTSVPGTFLKISHIVESEADEVKTQVKLSGSGELFTVNQTSAEEFRSLPKPVPQAVKDLLKLQHALSTSLEDDVFGRLEVQLRTKPISYLWSMLQWSGTFGNLRMMNIISAELAGRLNTEMKNGIHSVREALGI